MPRHQHKVPVLKLISCCTMLYNASHTQTLLLGSPLMGMREGDEGRPGCRFGLELYRGSLESLGEDTLFLLMLESPMEALLMLLFTCTLLP